MLPGESVGILCSERSIETGECLLHETVGGIQYGEILDIDDASDQRHLLYVQLGPDVTVDEKRDALGVVHQMVDAVRMEIAEDRDRHGTISVDGEEGHRPTGGILGADGDFIPLSDARLFEK